jgi:hypothetical protein
VRVAVSGGREYADRERVYDVLDEMHKREPITLIIQGQCYKGGADKLAEDWAEMRQVNCLSVPAKTIQHGYKAAGPIRNREMARFRPRWWVLFPGGRGTEDAKTVAESLPGCEVRDERTADTSSAVRP